MNRNVNGQTAWVCGISLMCGVAAAQAAWSPISSWTRDWQPIPPSWAVGDLTAIGPDGSVYVTARPDDGTGLGNAIAIIKYNPDGTLAWQVIRNGVGVGSEGIVDIEATAEGVAAIAISLDSTGSHPLILDYAADGTLRWDLALPGPVSGGFLAPQIAIANDGQRIVAYDDGAAGSLQRYTSDGTLIDAVPLSFSGFGGVSALGVDDDLNAIVVSVNDFTSYDIEKIDPAGNVLWSYSDQGTGLALSEAFLAVAANGDFVVTGSLEVGCEPDGITVNSRVWRFAADGTLQWSLDLPADGCNFQVSTDLAIGPQGEAYLTGVVSVGDPAELSRIDPDGTVAWTTSYSYAGTATSFSQVAVGPCGDVFVGGRDTNGLSFLDPRVVRFSPAGDLRWTGNVGDETMFLSDLAAGDDGGVVVVGTTRPIPSGFEDRATTVRLEFSVGTTGDLDCDGDVDAEDHLVFSGCLAGPGIDIPPQDCAAEDFDAADLDGDSDVDVEDFRAFQITFTGGGG